MNFEVKRPEFKSDIYNILDFGAKSEIGFNNKSAIQSAIDKCSEKGGGVVIIPDGYYFTGPIEIKSNVNLYVSNNAFVEFSKSMAEYPLGFVEYEGIRRIRAKSPITAKNAENIAITGGGILDGNGELWRGVKEFKLTKKQWEKRLKESPYVIEGKEGGIWCPTKSYYDGVLKGEPDYNKENVLEEERQYFDVYRPVFVSFVNCNKVLIEGVTLQNSPAWNIHPLYCKNFTLKNAYVKNPFYAQNGDGIDLESCENCEIANTIFAVGDDGICLKSGKNKEARKTKIPTKNVWIHDCKVFDAHGGFVVGSEMSRGIKNILVENCVFSGTDIGVRFKSAMGRGGVVEDIEIKNIFMSKIVNEAIIFTMGYKLVNIEDTKEDKIEIDMEDIPEFKNIKLDNIVCDGAKEGIKIEGLQELPIHDITFNNLDIKCNKDLLLSLCKDIKITNSKFVTQNEIKYYKNENFNA